MFLSILKKRFILGNNISCDHNSYLCLVVLNGAGMLNGERVVKERMKKLVIQDFLVYIKKKRFILGNDISCDYLSYLCWIVLNGV